MNTKRRVSSFVPIKILNNELFVYLQKRTEDAKRAAGFFGFWGGGCEDDENYEQGLVREVKEELSYDLNLSDVELFNNYEFYGSHKYFYLFKPTEEWEQEITVSEGEYGKWLSAEEIVNHNSVILEDKLVVSDIDRKLLNKPLK